MRKNQEKIKLDKNEKKSGKHKTRQNVLDLRKTNDLKK